MDVTKFLATVNQVRTLADGGLRLTLDLPENAVEAAAALMAAHRLDVVLEVTIQTAPDKHPPEELSDDDRTAAP